MQERNTSPVSYDAAGGEGACRNVTYSLVSKLRLRIESENVDVGRRTNVTCLRDKLRSNARAIGSLWELCTRRGHPWKFSTHRLLECRNLLGHLLRSCKSLTSSRDSCRVRRASSWAISDVTAWHATMDMSTIARPLEVSNLAWYFFTAPPVRRLRLGSYTGYVGFRRSRVKHSPCGLRRAKTGT